MKWESGRQGSGYLKLKLIESKFPLPFDLYLLKYPPGSSIGWHKDPVKDRRHFRMNIFLKQSKEGGTFVTKLPVLYGNRFLQIFRPDINEHCLTQVRGSTRYVLSLGWLR